ncbi:MAG: LCP family protein [Clostridia bacterium]|nr:LCP family protein [Clostridia bacterium]
MSQQNKNEFDNEEIRTDFEDFDVTFKSDDASNEDFSEVIIEGRGVSRSSEGEYLENVVLASGMAALQSERFRTKTRSDRAAEKALKELEEQSLSSLKHEAPAETPAEVLTQPSELAVSDTDVPAQGGEEETAAAVSEAIPAVAVAQAAAAQVESKPFAIDERDENSDKRRHRYSSRSHSKAARRWRKMKGWQRGIIIFLTVFLILVIAAVSTVYLMYYYGKKATMADNYGDNFQSSIYYNGVEYIYNTDITSIAFIGVDKRAFGINDDLVEKVGQNDVNMVLSVDTKTGDSHVVVLPRDSLVDVDKYSVNGEYMGSDKKQLCLAYSYGDGKSTSCDNAIVSMQRILYGVPINTYVALDLDGIAPLNDALGGITVVSPNDYEDKYKKGQEITLQGDAAEKFVRARESNLEGDAKRRERQIAYVKAYIAQAAERGLKNPALLRDIYNIGTGYTVSNLTLSRSMYFGSTMLSNPTEMLSFNNVSSLKGKLKLDKEGYALTVLDETSTLETVLDVYYTPLK